MFKKYIFILLLVIFALSICPKEGSAASYHSKAINSAKSQLGVKYKWGGMSSRGFDCSGLVAYSYGKAGKSLPRSASDIYKKTGKKVNRLTPGDLLFFTTSSKKKVSHVAIYLGSGKMIHSSSSKGVSITTTNNTYWKNKYIGAKRL